MQSNNFENDLDSLYRLAQQDLSRAHVAQHGHTAERTVAISSRATQGPGAHSVQKKLDTIDLKTNRLTGIKHWVSNLSRVNWCVLAVENRVIYVELDPRYHRIHWTPTVGMEATLTGNIEFDHAPYEIICDQEDDRYFPVRRCHSLGFVAIHSGLAEALYRDLVRCTESQRISCEYDLRKLRLQLDVMALLWQSQPKIILPEHQSHSHWLQKNTLYAHAKRCLLDTVQLVTAVTGSGLYRPGSPEHQRYLDSLIYSSHMLNLYRSYPIV